MAMELFFPTKGGDAVGRGMGQLIFVVVVTALVLLLVLNLLPFGSGT